MGFQRAVLLILVAVISIVFVAMIRPFLMTILLAGIFAGLAQPLYQRILHLVRNRRRVASLITMMLLIAVVVLPLLTILGVVADQALRISETAILEVQEYIDDPGELIRNFESNPLGVRMAPYRELILAKAGQLVSAASGFLFTSLSATTRGTVSFIFQTVMLLYTLFFLLSDGSALLRKILYYLPLEHADEQRMLDRFTSVARATVKGTLLIGISQGVLAGVAFAVVGIDGAFFWGTLMVLLSIVPGIGTGLVWLPAAVILLATGQTWAGIGLAIWCALVVGSIDNVLRPRLVGRDTEMHDLMILFSTLGGIMMFGVLGFVIGPIIAALFVTIWDIYGLAFANVLPAVGRIGDQSE